MTATRTSSMSIRSVTITRLRCPQAQEQSYGQRNKPPGHPDEAAPPKHQSHDRPFGLVHQGSQHIEGGSSSRGHRRRARRGPN